MTLIYIVTGFGGEADVAEALLSEFESRVPDALELAYRSSASIVKPGTNCLILFTFRQ